MSDLINQPTRAPTRKVTAALIGGIVSGAVVGGIEGACGVVDLNGACGAIVPALDAWGALIAGLVAGIAAYFTRERG